MGKIGDEFKSTFGELVGCGLGIATVLGVVILGILVVAWVVTTFL